MKFEIERRELIEALEPVSRLAIKSASMEILGHCLITAEEGKLSIRGTNLETFLGKTTAADVAEAGKCTLDGKKLLGLLKADKADTVTLETTSSDRVKVSTEDISATFRTLDAEEYPVFDENIKSWFDTSPEIFLKDISCILNASAGGRGAKQELASVFMETAEGKLVLSASDAKILMRIEREIVSENRASLIHRASLIPSTFLSLISNAIKGDSVVIGTSGENDNLVCFHTDNCHISSRVLEGSFPDISQVLNPYSKNHSAKLRFLRSDMEDVCSVMKPMALGIEKAVVKTRLEGNTLHIAHKNDNGTIVSDINVQKESGGDFTFFWQLDYMEKILAGLSQYDDIYMGLTNAISPIYFRNAGEGETQALIMPIKSVTWMEDVG